MSKYLNKRTPYDGLMFDSLKELARYQELLLLSKTGEIKNLKLQEPFVLLPPFTHRGVKYRGIKYIADFVYDMDNGTIVEDVKSEYTRKNPLYKVKKKLLLHANPDIDFREA